MNGGKEKIIVCTKCFFVMFSKHAQRITEVAAWRCFWFFFWISKVFRQNTIIIYLAKYWYCRNTQYSPRNKVNMAMFLLINASRNIQFFFFYITWTKFVVSFQSQNLHNRALQISMNFRNPKSIFIPLKHKYPSQQHIPFSTKGYICYFFLFQTTFSFSHK